jgi:hypothetical protein
VNNDTSVALTPHNYNHKPFLNERDYHLENLFMAAGLYNSGFYALKNDERTQLFLKWHKIKLLKYCYNAPRINMFVDQKILDFAPVIFDFVKMYKNPTYNIGHWNLENHGFNFKNDHYFVDGKRLVFFHFSQLNNNSPQVKNIPIIKKMVNEYQKKLNKYGFGKFHKIEYEFADSYVKPPLSITNPEAYLYQELSQTKTELEIAKKKINAIYASPFYKIFSFIKRNLSFIFDNKISLL